MVCSKVANGPVAPSRLGHRAAHAAGVVPGADREHAIPLPRPDPVRRVWASHIQPAAPCPSPDSMRSNVPTLNSKCSLGGQPDEHAVAGHADTSAAPDRRAEPHRRVHELLARVQRRELGVGVDAAALHAHRVAQELHLEPRLADTVERTRCRCSRSPGRRRGTRSGRPRPSRSTAGRPSPRETLRGARGPAWCWRRASARPTSSPVPAGGAQPREVERDGGADGHARVAQDGPTSRPNSRQLLRRAPGDRGQGPVVGHRRPV